MTKREFDMNLLKTLEILFQEGSVSRSAVRMGISQAAVSVQLAKLRAYFDDPLFVPSRSGLVPTVFAHSLAEPLSDLLHRSRSLISKRHSFDPATAYRRFSVSAGYTDTAIILSSVNQRLFKEAPGIAISCLSGIDRHNGKDAEYQIRPEGNLPARELHSKHLYTDRYVCLVDRNHSRFGNSLSEAEYFEATHITRRFGLTGPVSMPERHLEKTGRKRKEGPIIDNYATVASVLMGTDYVSTMALSLARFLAERFPFRILELPIELPKHTMLLCWDPSLESDPAAMWLRDVICETAHRAHGSASGLDGAA